MKYWVPILPMLAIICVIVWGCQGPTSETPAGGPAENAADADADAHENGDSLTHEDGDVDENGEADGPAHQHGDNDGRADEHADDGGDHDGPVLEAPSTAHPDSTDAHGREPILDDLKLDEPKMDDPLLTAPDLGEPKFDDPLLDDPKPDAAGDNTGDPTAAVEDAAVEFVKVKTDNGYVDATFPIEGLAGGVDVMVKGTLIDGMTAIGSETTGTIVKTSKIKWELDLSGDEGFRKSARELNGKKVVVTGTVRTKQGIEIPIRTIVMVTSLEKG